MPTAFLVGAAFFLVGVGTVWVGLWRVFARKPNTRVGLHLRRTRRRAKDWLWTIGWTATGMGCLLFAWVAVRYMHVKPTTVSEQAPVAEQVVGDLGGAFTVCGAASLVVWTAMK